MADKGFKYRDDDWTASYAGTGHGVGSVGSGGELPPITSHHTKFRRVSDGQEVTGWLSSNDPSSVPDLQLGMALAVALGDESEF